MDPRVKGSSPVSRQYKEMIMDNIIPQGKGEDEVSTSMMEDYYSSKPNWQNKLQQVTNLSGEETVIPATLTEKQEDYVTSDMRKIPYNIANRGLASVLNQLEGVVNDPNKPFLDQGSSGFLGFGGSDPQEPATKQEILNSLVEKGIVDINTITSQDLEQAGVTLPTVGLAGGGSPLEDFLDVTEIDVTSEANNKKNIYDLLKSFNETAYEV